MSTDYITLTPRLKAVANWVKKGSRFADIGTDHGYLPLYLWQQEQISSAIASDVNQGPLDAAKQMTEKYNIALDLRLSNGLQGISPDEVDCVAIAGMGGVTISQILQGWEENRHWSGTFLLQPMSTQYELRLWLNNNNYSILEEQIIPEGDTLYTALKVKNGQDIPYEKGELLLGRQIKNRPDPYRLEFLNFHLEKTEKILKKLGTDHSPRKAELEEQRLLILSTREEWNTWQQQ